MAEILHYDFEKLGSIFICDYHKYSKLNIMEIQYFDRTNTFLQSLKITFTNVLHTSIILIVVALGIASGYTTFKGMTLFINDWVALIVTIAVQFIIIISSYELSTTYFQAHKLRFIGLLIALIIGLIVSINFSYIMFYERSQANNEKVEKFEKMAYEMKNYLSEVKTVKGVVIDMEMEIIRKIEERRRRAVDGTLEGLPPRQRVFGEGTATHIVDHELDQEKSRLQKIKDEFNMFEGTEKIFHNNWRMEELDDPNHYATTKHQFNQLTYLADNILSNNGKKPIPHPEIMPWEDFIRSNPPYAFLINLSLILAIIIDVLTFIFSSCLQLQSAGGLSGRQKGMACLGFQEFFQFDLNSHDQLQIELNKTALEEDQGYNDGFRKLVIALLLNRGYLRRVNKDYVEFTPRLYDIILEQIEIDQAHSELNKKGVKYHCREDKKN
ncbi:MAG: hypothetical protein QG588_2143 [Candidatus Poribacteria bacterium]|nr:hypothetical protein [Candidatus Poribacteria bacterium]